MTNAPRSSVLLAIGLVAVTATLAAQGYVPQRVFESSRRAFSDFEVMLADLAKADVVFVGEQHDDPNTHRLELAILEGLARRRGNIVLSLEMFERDVQESLEHYAMGHLQEAEFLAAARPWPRYQTDYRPLVEFAIDQDWVIVAANVPRVIAGEIAKGGLAVLDDKPEADRRLFARDRECPRGEDPYFKRFMTAMGSHPGSASELYYFAQCVKDETMAESIAGAHNATPAARPLVVHVNGAFHSDFGAGAAERVRRRLPNARIAVVSITPMDNLDALAPSEDDAKRGDYLVFTTKPSK
jgi:uncharacterized iron-regulated protein